MNSKISITTGALQLERGREGLREYNECLRLFAEVGYRNLDLGFCHHTDPDYILAGDDWEAKIDELGNTAAKLGLEFYQSHIPFIKGGSILHAPEFRNPGYNEYFLELVRRAYIASARLGVKWAVLHPNNYPELNFDSKLSEEACRVYYTPSIELGIANGVGTAWENMLPYLDRHIADKYCSHIDQLISLCDSYNDPMVGICLDTGHANQMGYDMGMVIRQIGRRLKCLHLNDNRYSNSDEHLCPYMGSVDWETVIEELAAIGYEGSLNFESQRVTIHAYGKFQMDLLRFCYSVNAYLVDRFEEAVARKGANQ